MVSVSASEQKVCRTNSTVFDSDPDPDSDTDSDSGNCNGNGKEYYSVLSKFKVFPLPAR